MHSGPFERREALPIALPAVEPVDQPATLEDYAATDWEPWPIDALKRAPSNDEWARLANPHLVAARLAIRLMTKTKAEAIEVVHGLASTPDPDGLAMNMAEALIDSLNDSREWFQALRTR